MAAERREVASFDTPFEELKVGDSIFGPVPPSWQIVGAIPEIVAETWMVEHFIDSIMLRRQKITPLTGPMKEWEAGMGVVVYALALVAEPDKEKLGFLYKADKEKFELYLSKETRRKK